MNDFDLDQLTSRIESLEQQVAENEQVLDRVRSHRQNLESRVRQMEENGDV